MIAAEELRKTLDYDPDTGIFRWKVQRRGVVVGAIAGSKNTSGYIVITYKQKHYYAHRLAWLYVHAHWPRHEIDHINGDPSDNRMNNLREATHKANGRNAKRPSDNKSGVCGIYQKTNGRWVAQIGLNAKVLRLGTFDTKDEAAAARQKAEAKYGFAPGHGRASTPD